jgi:methanogenic corrinoid protein MtbC1
MESAVAPALSIASVERETGLSKDVLRKWEIRYGFPAPLRDSQGERLYPPDQVNRLRLIRRLMDTGMRPARLVAETDESLRALADASTPGEPTETPGGEVDVEQVTLAMLRNLDPDGLRRRLYREMLRQGLECFVLDTLSSLNVAVGEAWARGSLGVHEEHLYSESVQWLLRNAISNLSDARGAPRILLTTLPEEQHGLGILMAAALFSLRGAYCISLGTQTPVQVIAQAAQAHRADIVALSFSNAYPQRRVVPAVSELCQSLQSGVAVWAGGGGVFRLSQPDAAEALFLPTLRQALASLSAWQAAQQSTH